MVFIPDSCCTDKTKSIDVFYTHLYTFAITIYNIFLRALFINFDRYYYKPSTTVFILKNVPFSVRIRILQIKQSLWMYFKHIKTHWLMLFTTFSEDTFL